MKLFISKSPYLILSAAFLFLQSCKKDDPEVINEEELITRVVLELTPTGGAASSYTWNEGDGALSLNLAANTTYEVAVFFYDASDPSDVENITEEVEEEADEHLVFYDLAATAPVSIASSSNDVSDSDNVPVRLVTRWTASAAGSANARLYLIHEPTNKGGATRSAIGGETDVEVSLQLNVN